MIKCGFVGIVGRPNSGKSTLVNALVNEKVSIVSPKAQTTRNNILGIMNDKAYQIVLIDTPGVSKINNRLDEYMQKNVSGAITDVDVLLITIDSSKDVNDGVEFAQRYINHGIHTIILLTKIDLISKEQLFKKLTLFNNIEADAIIPISSVKRLNLDELVKEILKYLPEVADNMRYFDQDIYTDKSLRFIASEIIREKSLYYLDKEIPHGIAVEITKFVEEGNLVTIDANIICEKDSHKAIIIGKGGKMLKKIGHEARVSIQKVVQNKVVLNLWVKVKENWRDRESFLTEIGYNNDDL